ncbi:RPA1 [Symbiodinium sp. CCMP2456]|nr:RPA1 [Symbiodinium sp. CCMP2456]
MPPGCNIILLPRPSLDFCCCAREENGLTVLKGICESPRLGLAETLNLCGDAQQPGLPVEVRPVRKVPAERAFKVKLQKLEDGFGLKYDASDSSVLLVQRLTDGGAASQWNQTAQPKIQPYDRVVEVGKCGLMSSSEMLKAPHMRVMWKFTY